MIKHKVNIYESERGWGQEFNRTQYFDTLDDAIEFANHYNSFNDAPEVPDWYQFAKYMGQINVDLDDIETELERESEV